MAEASTRLDRIKEYDDSISDHELQFTESFFHSHFSRNFWSAQERIPSPSPNHSTPSSQGEEETGISTPKATVIADESQVMADRSNSIPEGETEEQGTLPTPPIPPTEA